MALTSPPLLSSLRKHISKCRLDDIADFIVENAVECYTMEIAEPEDYSETGNTRFGGDPDLPRSFARPTDTSGRLRQYCNFVAQINFSDLPSLHGGSPLPRTGVLSLFVRSLEGAANPVLVDGHFFDSKTLSFVGPNVQTKTGCVMST